MPSTSYLQGSVPKGGEAAKGMELALLRGAFSPTDGGAAYTTRIHWLCNHSGGKCPEKSFCRED